jgi:zinc and cadmium transporter
MLKVIVLTLISGALSVLLSAGIFFNLQRRFASLSGLMTAFSAGVLLVAACIDLIPEALGSPGTFGDKYKMIGLGLIVGVVSFFTLEKVLQSLQHDHRGQHDHGEDTHVGRQTAKLVMIGDTLHNVFDGVAIGASLLVSWQAALITTLAIALHELPHEIGDFAVLINAGYTRKRAIIFNVVSSLAALVGGMVTYYFGDRILPLPFLLAMTAGFFLYISLSDIIPSIHETRSNRDRRNRTWLFYVGVGLSYILLNLADKIGGH